VEDVHQAVFGYGLAIDPAVHRGPCVKKSKRNAAHDGVILQCPCADIDERFVYQRLIDNRFGDSLVEDVRVPIFRAATPFCYVKRRPIADRFSNENRVALMREPDEEFSQSELDLIRGFCSQIGLDYGELDVLRDAVDGRIYIIDVNNTPFGPPNHLDKSSSRAALERLSNAFAEAFLS
jgi:hypothetical protein